MKTKSAFFTLLLMISFASVNAVLFTPALPSMAHYFAVSSHTAQQTITWFLIGYAIGQLLYGPIANRFGRKPALYVGIGIQILSSGLCIVAGYLHNFELLVIARFLLALGSGVGLKMTFTLVNESYVPKEASRLTSYLMLSFAVTPGLSVALGGLLTAHYGWMSCFYAGAIYGVILLLLVLRLPETQTTLQLDALEWKHLVHGYTSQFKNLRLVCGGLLMGSGTAFIYVFAALAPFIAMNLLGLKVAQYGLANLLPPVGLVVGSLISAALVKHYSLLSLIRTGIIIAALGTVMMFIAVALHLPALWSLFAPTVIIYTGVCFIGANSTSIAMSTATDKAHGAAVMSFANMGFATLIVLSLGLFPMSALLLPIIYAVLCGFMMVFAWLVR